MAPQITSWRWQFDFKPSLWQKISYIRQWNPTKHLHTALMLFCHYFSCNLAICLLATSHMLLDTEIHHSSIGRSVSPELFGMGPCSFWVLLPVSALRLASLAAILYLIASTSLLFHNQSLCWSRRMWMCHPFSSKSVCVEDRILRSCNCQLTYLETKHDVLHEVGPTLHPNAQTWHCFCCDRSESWPNRDPLLFMYVSF